MRQGGGKNRKQVLLTIDELRASLSYDPATGVFTNTRSAPGSRRVGPVGTKNRFNGYVSIMRGNKNYLAHRLAWAFMYGRWPECIDHINGVRDDNRICNLRECTQAQNNMNVLAYRGRPLAAKGIYFHSYPKHPEGGFWTAQIQASRVRRYLGSFATEQDARAAYNAAAEELFGIFRRTA